MFLARRKGTESEHDNMSSNQARCGHAPCSGDLGSSLDIATNLLCDLEQVTFLLWACVSLPINCEVRLDGLQSSLSLEHCEFMGLRKAVISSAMASLMIPQFLFASHWY